VPEAKQDHRLGGVLAQEEAAEGTFDAQDFLFLHDAEHVVGELAARQVAQVQLDARARLGSACAARWPSSSCGARRRAG
jgi:hypothetical protein